MQNGLVRRIAEVHMVKYNAPLQLGIGQRSIVMRMLPRPHSGMLFSFPQLAVRFLDVHQRYIALVGFRLLIHECKDAGSACQRRHNGVELVGNLRDGVVEIAGKRQERSDCAKCQRPRSLQTDVGTAGNCHIAAQYRNNDILHIAKGIHHRHHGVGVAVGTGGGSCPRAVFFGKLLFCGFLMAENLNDLLPVYHFLHITVDIRKRFLLHQKETADLFSDHPDDLQDQKHDQHGNQCQIKADIEHTNQYRHDGKDRGNELRHGLCDHLAKGIGVVGIKAHNIAVGAGIKGADGKPLHFFKHFVPNLFQRSLCNGYHDTVIKKRGKNTDQIDCADHDQHLQKLCEYRGRACEQRCDIIVDQGLQEQRRSSGRNGAEQNTDHHKKELSLIVLHIGKQPQQCLSVKLLLLHSISRNLSVFLIHGRCLLSSGIHTLLCKYHRFSAIHHVFRTLRFCHRP